MRKTGIREGTVAQQIALAGLQVVHPQATSQKHRCDGGPGCAGEGPGRQRAWIPCDETFGAPVGSPAGSTHIPEEDTEPRSAGPAPSPTSSLELKKTQGWLRVVLFLWFKGPISPLLSQYTSIMLNRGHGPQLGCYVSEADEV